MSVSGAVRDRRGQPLWAMGSLLLCWIVVRAVLIDWPAEDPGALGKTAEDIMGLATATGVELSATAAAERLPTALVQAPATAPIRSVGLAERVLAPPEPLLSRPTVPNESQYASAHNLLWMAAMSAIPLLSEVASVLAEDQTAAARRSDVRAVGLRPRSRWSGDAWVLWRAGSRPFAPSGPITPTYGGSQAGALLRYDLAPASRSRPVAYVRAASALASGRGQDLGVGLAARPIAGLPLTAHGELRVSRRQDGTTLRPAAFVSGGIDDATLAGGVTARGYAQAGYLSGPDATGFADGSLIAEKPLWRERGVEVTAGAGAWGGAQRGAARLDLGPSASLRFRLGEGTARLSADYRLRVAGNGAPAGGVAVTLSAGF